MRLQIVSTLLVFGVAFACSKQPETLEKTAPPVLVPAEKAATETEAAKSTAPASHEEHHHAAPHGGALIMLGDHAGHLEFVLDAATGTLTMYALDGEAEEPVRLNSIGIGMQITVAGKPSIDVQVKPVENVLTGETGTSTSQYSVQSDALKDVTAFTAVIPELAFRGMELDNFSVSFPGGNE